MITLFIVLASGIVIKCVGGTCDTMSTALFSTMAVEGSVELVFAIKGMVRIFKEKGSDEPKRRGRPKKE